MSAIRKLSLVCALTGVVLVSAPGRASLVTQDRCSDVTATTSVFKQVGTGVEMLENLGFDGLGALWISDQTAGELQRYAPDGTLLSTMPVSSPGAITLSPDRWLYVNFGDSAAGAVQGKLGLGAGAGVIAFDPAAVIPGENPAPAPIVTGLKMANGATFDEGGNLYVSNDMDTELTRIRRDSESGNWAIDREWSDAADVWGTNGLVVAGNDLYAAITFDMRSPIEVIPLKNPGEHRTFTQLNAGGASLKPAAYLDPAHLDAPLAGVKGLDDMTIHGHHLYVVANALGELLRVDLHSGEACLLASGLRNPSSVRFARSFDGYDEGRDLFVTEWSGAIKVVRLSKP